MVVITEEMLTKLDEVATLQTEMWRALGELETITGLEIDSTQDLAATTIEALFEADDEEGRSDE